MKRYLLLLVLPLILFVVSCGHKEYAKGKYIDPDTVILRSDKFVESDLKIIADRLVNSLLASPVVSTGGKPIVVLMSKLTNSTDEHIDMLSLSEKIMVELHQSGQVELINTRLRGAIKEEHKYQEEGFVDRTTAKRKGRQIGAAYLISGNISAIKQPVGRQEIVYYKATLELTNLEKNTISWMDDVEIKKRFKKRYVGS